MLTEQSNQNSKLYLKEWAGTIENSMLKYDVEYRTDITNAKKFYIAVYDDRGNVVAISGKQNNI